MTRSSHPPGTSDVPDEWSAQMRAAQAGDSDAYRALLIALVPYVRAIAARAFHDPADIDDVVQDVLVTLHATRQMFDPSRPFRPWLAAITRRRVVDRLRRDLRRRGREVTLVPAHETFPADTPNSQETASEGASLRLALAQLTGAERQAIELMKLRELSLQEASLLSGQSVTSLKVATHRAIKRLRRLLAVPKNGETA